MHEPLVTLANAKYGPSAGMQAGAFESTVIKIGNMNIIPYFVRRTATYIGNSARPVC